MNIEKKKHSPPRSKDAHLLEKLVSFDRIGPLLRGLGVFVKDYSTGACIPNTLWKELGHSEKDMRADRWLDFVHPEDVLAVRCSTENLITGVADAWEGEYRIRGADGAYRTISHRALVLERTAEGVPSLYVGWDVDISEYSGRIAEGERRCDALKRRYLRSEEIRNAGVILASELDPAGAAERMLNQAMIVVPYDAAAVRSLGDGESIVLATMGFDRFGVPGDAPPRGSADSEACSRTPIIYTPATGPYRSLMTVPLCRRDQVVGCIDFYAECPDAFGVEDLAGAMIFAEQAEIVFSNALRYKETEQEAATDWLTGLPTRRAFMARAVRLSLDSPKNESLAMLMLDIDHFKLVNDNFGHPAGDAALVAVASACREVLRAQDICCRYGGEEILICLPGADERIALAAAERVRNRILAIRVEGHPDLRLTASVGISAGTFGEDFRDIIARADEALYMAKESGRNRCETR